MVGYKQKLKRALSPTKSSRPSQASHSCLGDHLLLLWGRGEVSANAIQKLAHAAILDGCDHPELHTLAAFGNYGKHSGNITRDLKTYLEKGANKLYPKLQILPTGLWIVACCAPQILCLINYMGSNLGLLVHWIYEMPKWN